MAIGPINDGAKRDARKMAVGPSAPPIIPIEAASARLKPNGSRSAPMSVAKIPNWAAAPSRAVFGLASNGPKSVIAPTPMKISSGNNPVATPMS